MGKTLWRRVSVLRFATVDDVSPRDTTPTPGEIEVPAPGGNPLTTRPRRASDTELSVLVDRCVRGDQHAWDELVRRVNPLIWTVARSMRLSTADCEDVCQVTWLRVLENIGSIRQFDRASAWIVTAAKREALRQLRRSAKHVPVGDDDIRFDRDSSDATPEEHVVANADREEVLAAFRQLPEHHQALISLLIADPAPSYDEISAQLNIPRGSIGPTRRRILRRVRELMDAEQPVVRV
jgi:RNA polymerase sigma factor (sigma-70 family)